MAPRCTLGLCVLSVVLVQGAWTFNIGVKSATVFQLPTSRQFAYSVRQFSKEQENWLLITDPWAGNVGERSGQIYRCPVKKDGKNDCKRILLDSHFSTELQRNMSMGLSLSGDERTFVACAPLWVQRCGSSFFPVGACQVKNTFTENKFSITPTWQDCSKPMDIIFLLDGSNSIYDWSKVREFLIDVLKAFDIGPMHTQVGVHQYAEKWRVEFDLNTHTNKDDILETAKQITQLMGLETRTASAMDKAREHGFTLDHGGRPEAAKVMVVVTDGESHDSAILPAVISKFEVEGITRYAIAVLSSYIRKHQDPTKFIKEIKSIASSPVNDHFFNVTDEGVLIGLAETLGDRIFSLEGSSDKNKTTINLEMSQAGFSAHLMSNELLLGAVGAYEWTGTVVRYNFDSEVITVPPHDAFGKEFPLEMKQPGSYLGYAVTSGVFDEQTLYVAGAPRFNHTGKVVVFSFGPKDTINVQQSLLGQQIGSYFGGELCTMDVNGDWRSDLLLVAAPMFMDRQGRETGKVYVFALSKGTWQLENELFPAEDQGQASRFGSALSPLTDLNHDRFAELAVGAPLENDGQGALYLFSGHGRTLDSKPSQRIPAADVMPGLRYFGRSIHGKLDMDGNGIADIAVGADNKALLLWSRPVASIWWTVKFSPTEINLQNKNCLLHNFCLVMTMCYQSNLRLQDATVTSIALMFNITLDPERLASRMRFLKYSEKTMVEEIDIRPSSEDCMEETLYLIDLVDIIKPIVVRITWTMMDADTGPVLDVNQPHSQDHTIEFARDCGADKKCVTDLVVILNSTISETSKSPFIITTSQNKMKFAVTLENRKENAYFTHLNISHSANLMFVSTEVNDETIEVECSLSQPYLQSKTCNVGYPVFKSGSKVTIVFEFEFTSNRLLPTVDFDAQVFSDSEESPETQSDNAATLSVSVRYQADLLFTRDSDITSYEINMSSKPQKTISSFDNIGSELNCDFQIQNDGLSLTEDLYLKIDVPYQSKQNSYLLYLTKLHTYPTNEVLCNSSAAVDPLHIASHPFSIDYVTEDFSNIPNLTCQTAKCMQVLCRIPTLAKRQAVGISMQFRLWNGTFHQATFKTLSLITSAHLELAANSLIVIPDNGRERTVSVQIVKREEAVISVGIIIGSIIGGMLLLALVIFVLWKVNFFHRPYQLLMQEEPADQGEDNPLNFTEDQL
uniref:integrin alpha-11-like n=1 Tax=Myxine glutinosa TaxID=7769 RepID=UPI00358EB0AE